MRLSIGAEVKLDCRLFTIEERNWKKGEHPLSVSGSLAELSTRHLTFSEPPDRRVSLNFARPTAFKSGSNHQPLPLAELVLGSLLERWNSYSPVAFPLELRRYAAECLAVSRFQISNRTVPLKGPALRIGAVGDVVYTTTNYVRYWMSLVETLAEYDLFCGVGAGTSIGMGQCWRDQPEG